MLSDVESVSGCSCVKLGVGLDPCRLLPIEIFYDSVIKFEFCCWTSPELSALRDFSYTL